MIISRSPFRVSFFGGGTDFPAFYRRHGGATLLTTLDRYCYISLHRLSPLHAHRFRASYSKTELVMKPSEFQHPLIRECLLMLGIKQGLDISHAADLPGRTGLGSSSAFVVGLLNALHALRGESRTAEDLAREAIEVERNRVGDPGGHQDQYAAAYGGLLRLDFGADGAVRVKGIPLAPDRRRELERHLMLFYLGAERCSTAISAEQQRRVRSNTAALLKMRALVDAAERALCGPRPLSEFGRLLHESWLLKKTLSRGISNPPVDDAYAEARRAGALGGKLLGAGGGGFLLVFARPSAHAAVRKRLSRLQEIPLAMGTEGSRIVFRSDET